MAFLTHLTVENFRIVQNTHLVPTPGINFIVGPNASGKTSLLEAIYFLARGRSFRESNWRLVRRDSTDYLRVTGKVQSSPEDHVTRLGVERNDTELLMRVDGRTLPNAKGLLETLPLLLIEPESHRLVAQGPAYRRRLLDWGVFHVEHRFYPTWQRYRRAWRQRNAVLRERNEDAPLEPWEHEMGQMAEELDRQRRDYIAALAPRIARIGEVLLDRDDLTLRYHRGWPDEQLGVVLERARARDRLVGYTRHGPHRGDLVLYLGEHKAAERVSRGQQKLLIFCLVLAQAQLLESHGVHRKPVLLIDDLAAELDRQRIATVTTHVGAMGIQVFITGTDTQRFPLQTLPEHGMFHVEHGGVAAVV